MSRQKTELSDDAGRGRAPVVIVDLFGNTRAMRVCFGHCEYYSLSAVVEEHIMNVSEAVKG